MTELSGTLEGVGLPAIVRFLAGLGKTGALRISHENWRGEVFFDDGLVVGAALGSRRGVTALDGLMRALPGGAFVFDSETRLDGAPDIIFTREQLLAHLDGSDDSGPPLPALDTVPHLVSQDDDASGDETVPLDRGTLQTLLAIDGVRTVRDVIGVRGSFEALWQVANLAQVGLVQLESPTAGAATPVKAKTNGRRAARAAAPTAVPESAPSASVVAPVAQAAPAAAAPTRVVPASAAPTSVASAPAPVLATDVVHCSKLGFEDDPNNSFGRPTRLHRCFAAGTPLPLSLDQQRELCLSDQYGTCPRLSMAGLTPPAAKLATPPAPDIHLGEPKAPAEQGEPVEDDPRIVRLPFGGRPAAGARPAAIGTSTAAPTPLRARAARSGAAAAAAAVAEPAPEAQHVVESVDPERPVRPAVRASVVVDRPGRLPFLPLPGLSIAVVGIVVMVLVVVGALLAPHLGDLFSDEQGVDMSELPNSNAVVSGTPISELPIARATADAAAPSGTNPQPAPTVIVPDSIPRTQPTAVPTVAPTATVPAGPRTIFEDTFDTNANNWPNNPQGTAWITGGSYRIAPRQAGQFVAVGAPPVGEILQDVVVNATFHKVGGPAGGGYGIIVRDQGPGPRDGNNQQGRYYVLEVGDKGEVGIWRRDGDKWIDILPWQRSDLVKPGNASNDVTVRAVGDKFSLSVNGKEVGVRSDATLAVGNVGLFVGGDGNQVAVDQFSITTP